MLQFVPSQTLLCLDYHVFDILCDILCIQETWCAIQDAFCSFVQSTTDCNNDDLVTGHLPGGNAIV